MTDCMLTTVDNPYDPFTQFDSWYQYDEEKGYYTCSYLARIAVTSPDLPEEQNEAEIERAMDEICYFNPKLYVKVPYGEKLSYPIDSDLKNE